MASPAWQAELMDVIPQHACSHHGGDLEHLGPIVFVGLQRSHFGSQRGSPLQAGGTLEDRAADGFRPAEPRGF